MKKSLGLLLTIPVIAGVLAFASASTAKADWDGTRGFYNDDFMPVESYEYTAPVYNDDAYRSYNDDMYRYDGDGFANTYYYGGDEGGYYGGWGY